MKKNSQNMLGNSYKKSSSVLDQDEENEKNYCSLEIQEPLEVQLPNHNSITSWKQLIEIHESNQRENNIAEKDKYLTAGNVVLSHKNLSKNLYAGSKPNLNHDTEVSKLSGEICNISIKKPQNRNQCIDTNKILEPGLREEFPLNYAQKNNTLHENYKNNSTLYFPIKESTTGSIKTNSGSQSSWKEEDDKLTFARNLIDESEEEYPTSDFFKPSFDDWNKCKSIQVYGLPLEKDFHRPDDKNNLWAKNTFVSEAGCSGYRNYVKPAFKGEVLKDTISYSVHAYKNSKEYFSNMYHTWLPQRKNTLQKLETLKEEVHNTQLSYNKSQESLREVAFISRSGKNSDSQVVDFFASFTAFLSDATSGIVSVVQAFNVESYQNKFKEIMELDAEITQQLYKARSQCITRYHNIEEVMRKFHFDNLSSTISKISDSLEIDKYWESIKRAYEKNNMPQLLNIVNNFFDNACQFTKLKEVSDSIENYIEDNPAALDAFKSAGRATYGAVDSLKLNQSKNKAARGIDFTANHLLMVDDRLEIQRLRSTMEEDSPQSKLEAQIEEAIDHLESELREIKNIYLELFKSHGDSNCDKECDIYVN